LRISYGLEAGTYWNHTLGGVLGDFSKSCHE
jgi:hypothetical protein